MGEVRALPNAARSPLNELQAACNAWITRVGTDPHYLIVADGDLKELRLELRLALRCEMPSIDDMRKVAARGELRIGGFPVYIGAEYGAGVHVRREVAPPEAANEPINPVSQTTGD